MVSRAKKTETIEGVVERVFHSSPGWSAGKLRSDNGGIISVAGSCTLREGEKIKLTGSWKVDPTYGRQFAVTSCEFVIPTDTDGIAAYIAGNPAIKGIGPAKARKLAHQFGSDWERSLSENSEAMAHVAGVKLDVIHTLRDEWNRTAVYNQAATWLAAFGLTHHQIQTLVEKYGNNVIPMLQDDPYRLIQDLRGFGFKKVDLIALKMGTVKTHPGRILAGVLQCLRDAANDGHTWTDYEVLAHDTNRLLIMDDLNAMGLIDAAIGRAVTLGMIATEQVGERLLAALPPLLNQERTILHFLEEADVAKPVLEEKDIPKDALSSLTPGQDKAVRLAMQHRVVVMTGGAGTGKTYTVNTICDLYESRDLTVTLCAPTGKAAKRLEESTGREAFTIHRLLQYNGHIFEFDGEIDTDLLVIDECFDYKQPILTEKGWRYIGEIVNSQATIRVWSRNPNNGCLELKPIIRWLKHPAPAKLLKICASRSSSMRSARNIRCTPDHKVLTPYGYRRASELRVGEEIIAKGFHFSSEQQSIIVGSLLGDGSLCRDGKRKSPQVMLMQGEDQRDYLKFKRRAFGVLAGKVQQGQSGYTDKIVWRLGINTIDDIYEISKEMVFNGDHPSGRRRWTPTNRFLDWIDELALTIWFLDNGSLHSHILSNGSTSYYASLHTQRFSKEDNHRFADLIEKRFGITVTVANDSRGFFFLRFGKKSSNKLLDIIRSFTPACMSYKTGIECEYSYIPENQPETCIARIKSIEEVDPTVGSVYDIEVADYHNYIAGNIVVSNCSMVDVPLFAELIRHIDTEKTSLLLVGDHNQLPPVGPGNVLRDLIQHNLTPIAMLDQVVRQAGALKRNSTEILRGKVAPSEAPDPALNGLKPWQVIPNLRAPEDLSELLTVLYSNVLHDKYGLDLTRDVQVLTPQRKGPLGVGALNLLLQRIVQHKCFGLDIESVKANRRPKLYRGDKIIQRRNNYDLGIMNGTVGVVKSVAKGEIEADFDGNLVTLKSAKGHLMDVDLAYALTIHQTQGSEFPVVLVVCHKSHSFMHHRNLLYTGVTRAKRSCAILGDHWGIRNCAEKVDVAKRRTWLDAWAKAKKDDDPVEDIPF